MVRQPSFFQLGIFLTNSSLERSDCISIVSFVARPLLCSVRILCHLCLLTAVWSARWWPVEEMYRQLDWKRGTEILCKIRDGTGIFTHKLHVICGFRSVASTAPMIVLNGHFICLDWTLIYRICRCKNCTFNYNFIPVSSPWRWPDCWLQHAGEHIMNNNNTS